MPLHRRSSSETSRAPKGEVPAEVFLGRHNLDQVTHFR